MKTTKQENKNGNIETESPGNLVRIYGLPFTSKESSACIFVASGQISLKITMHCVTRALFTA